MSGTGRRPGVRPAMIHGRKGAFQTVRQMFLTGACMLQADLRFMISSSFFRVPPPGGRDGEAPLDTRG